MRKSNCLCRQLRQSSTQHHASYAFSNTHDAHILRSVVTVVLVAPVVCVPGWLQLVACSQSLTDGKGV